MARAMRRASSFVSTRIVLVVTTVDVSERLLVSVAHHIAARKSLLRSKMVEKRRVISRSHRPFKRTLNPA
jgi:hypothetical protein